MVTCRPDSRSGCSSSLLQMGEEFTLRVYRRSIVFPRLKTIVKTFELLESVVNVILVDERVAQLLQQGELLLGEVRDGVRLDVV